MQYYCSFPKDASVFILIIKFADVFRFCKERSISPDEFCDATYLDASVKECAGIFQSVLVKA